MKSCRACRLDKCLLEGMDPTMVEAEQSPAQRQFIQSLYKRREFLQQQQQQLQKQNEKEMEIKNEKDTEIKKEKNNNENENGTSDEINEENQTFCQTPDPILSNEFCRSETVPVTGLLHTMPQFVMLEPTNQANFTAVPLSEFPVSFGSSTINSQIVTNIPNNSFSPLFIYYQNNNPLFQFSEEEFLMVSAFVASNSAISGLSDAGRLALQHLSEHYTNTLMNHLRTNHGNMAATLRYAELARQAESLLFSTRLQPTEFYQRRI
ncbi:hypothetical protein niasHT_001401 [Heterodera trifolii]|uniref:Nuclear receptor domain-containing protein n=1 Tax=Heterodera trifolii TaxID=157864 RepID=A0ABD2LNF6_9BILA